MSNKDNGGTAFPMQDPQAIHAYASAAVSHLTDPDARDAAYMAARATAIGGMTLRDYFAAKALGGMLADPSVSSVTTHRLAVAAYDYADAMLEAREQ